MFKRHCRDPNFCQKNYAHEFHSIDPIPGDSRKPENTLVVSDRMRLRVVPTLRSRRRRLAFIGKRKCLQSSSQQKKDGQKSKRPNHKLIGDGLELC